MSKKNGAVGMAFKMPFDTHSKAKTRSKELNQSLQDFVCSAVLEVSKRPLSKGERDEIATVKRAAQLRKEIASLEVRGY